MTSIFATTQFDERRVFRVLRRRAALIVLCAVIGGAVGFAAGALRGQDFEAAAQVVLARPSSSALLGGSTNANDAARSAANELQIMESDRISTAAQTAAGHELSVTISAVEGSDVALVTADAPSADGAAADANSYAQAYVSLRGDEVKRTQDAAVSSLLKQLTDLQAKIDPLDARVRNAADTTERDAVVAEVTPIRNALLSQQTDLQSRLTDFQIRSEVSSTEPTIAAPAVAPLDSSANYPILYALLGAIFGLLVGVWLAFTIERARGKVVDATDLRMGGIAPRAVVRVPGAKQPAAQIAAYQRLAASIAPGEISKPAHVFTVVPTDAAAPGTDVAAGLAKHLSAFGRRVALLDGSHSAAVLNASFDLPDEQPGLAEVMDGQLRLSEALIAARGVVFLPSGNGHAADPIDPNKFVAVLEELRYLVDVIVVDVPAPSVDASTLALAPVADNVVLVTAAGRTMVKTVQEVSESITQDGPVAIVIAPPRSRTGTTRAVRQSEPAPLVSAKQ